MPLPPPRHASGSYRIPADARIAALERTRLEALARVRDPWTRAICKQLGVTAGWHCLEVGAGAGTFSRWLAQRVGPSGSVLSTDVDLRFHVPAEGVLDVRLHDITRDPLPGDHFDLVHARAVLQHLPEREEALDRMIRATRPGGWVFAEESDWSLFDAQALPEAFRKVHELTQRGAEQGGREANFGRRLLEIFRQRGLDEVEIQGHAWTMCGGTDSAEWYVLALEHGAPRLVEAGLLTRAQLDTALAEARSGAFRFLSPMVLGAWGRKRR